MSEEVVSKIQRTLSLQDQDPLDFLRRTAELYYSNECDMKKIKKQLSAPAGSISRPGSGSPANGLSSLAGSCEEDVDHSFAQHINSNSSGGSRIAIDGVSEDSDDEDESAAHYQYLKEISTESESDISTYEEDPESYLKSASARYFNEVKKDEKIVTEDTECRVKEDSIAVENWALSCLPFLEPARSLLQKCEKIVLKEFEDHIEAFDVEVEDGEIHTLHVCDDPSNCPKSELSIPLVMVHGMGGAIPAFYRNYRDLARGRCVFGIDMPGFGLSTRVDFSTDPKECEEKMVDMIDQWREKMDIKKMILLGHSFGGYISALYALSHPEHVHHLVLLEPWGVFGEGEDKSTEPSQWQRVAMYLCSIMKTEPFSMFTCFGYLLGNSILKLLKSEDRKHYGDTCMDYLVRLNTTGKPTGAKAFSVISNFTFQYPNKSLKKILLDPISNEELELPLTMVCGGKSTFGKNIKENEVRSCPPYMRVHSIDEADHHVQVERPLEVTKYILKNVYF